MEATFNQKYQFVKYCEAGHDPRQAANIKVEQDGIRLIGPEDVVRSIIEAFQSGNYEHEQHPIEPPEEPSPELVEEINRKAALYETMYSSEGLELVEAFLPFKKAPGNGN